MTHSNVINKTINELIPKGIDFQKGKILLNSAIIIQWDIYIPNE